MITRWIIFPTVCILGWIALCAVLGQIDATNEAYRQEQRP